MFLSSHGIFSPLESIRSLEIAKRLQAEGVWMSGNFTACFEETVGIASGCQSQPPVAATAHACSTVHLVPRQITDEKRRGSNWAAFASGTFEGSTRIKIEHRSAFHERRVNQTFAEA